MNVKLGVNQLEDRAVPSATLEVTVENLAEEGGLYQTPFWLGVHEGRFDIGSPGRDADRFPGLEILAEDGITGELSERFTAESAGVDTTLTAPGGFPGAPVFDPGESATTVIEVDDPSENRFFSFASMVIPSNDTFLGNLNSRQYRLFNRDGDFRGPLTITLYGRDAWDSGTEVNDPFGGAAFSAEGGTSLDENGRIRRSRGLDDFIGTRLPTGETLESAFDRRTPLARITVTLGQGPQGVGEAANVTEAGATSTDVTVTFTDPSGVDVTSIDPTDLVILGIRRGGFFFVQPTGVTLGPVSEDGTSVSATYTVPAPGGEFDTSDNGRYFVFLQGGAVEDSLGNGNRLRFIDSFSVRV